MSEFKVERVMKTVSAKVSEDVHMKFKMLAKLNEHAMSKLIFNWVTSYVDANWDESVPERLAELEAQRAAEKAAEAAATDTETADSPAE